MGQFRALAGVIAKAGASAAQGVVTLFTATPALNADDANSNTSLRVVCAVAEDPLSHVRVTLQPGTSNSLTIIHASVGKWAGDPNYADTAAAPIELTFNGNSGFAGATEARTSDWVDISGLGIASGDSIVVIYDIPFNASTASQRYNNAATNAATYYQNGIQSWNTASTAGLGFNKLASVNYSVVSIETQDGGEAAARPDSTNTGYLNAPGYSGSLASGPGTVVSNTTYSHMEFSGGTFIGSLSTPVSNVTFYGCRFVATGEVNTALFGDNITFEYCSFEPADASAAPVTYAQGYQYGIVASGSYNSFVEKLTVLNCDMWGLANGIDVFGSTQAKPHVFRNNWIHDPRDDGGVDHTDGLGNQSGGGSSHYVVIDNNVIEAVGNTNAIAFQGGTYNNMTITNNLFGGYGYTLSVYDTAPNLAFTDNVFSTRYQNSFGPLREDWTAYSGLVWQRNRWHVPSGAAWGTPANDGKFWMPVAGASSDDSTFVSDTDYAG
jgi:hypothetical protein